MKHLLALFCEQKKGTNMTYKPVLLIASILASGCMGDKAQEGRPGDDLPGSCTGFQSPGANIYVQDALDDGVIEDATVIVNLIGESASASHEATYISSDDGLSNSETGAYYTLAEINELNYLINVVVTADGYQDYLSEDMEFVVHTECWAENNFNYTASLCREGSVCE